MMKFVGTYAHMGILYSSLAVANEEKVVAANPVRRLTDSFFVVSISLYNAVLKHIKHIKVQQQYWLIL